MTTTLSDDTRHLYAAAGVPIIGWLADEDYEHVWVLGHAETPSRQWRHGRLRSVLSEIDGLALDDETFADCADAASSVWMLPGCESGCPQCMELLGLEASDFDEGPHDDCTRDWWYLARNDDSVMVVRHDDRVPMPELGGVMYGVAVTETAVLTAVPYTQFDLA